MLFLIYINDLVDSIDTDITITLFADDTKLSLIYNNLNDRDKLQSAINKFYNWSVLWQLENSAKKLFSLTLCKVTIPTYYVNDARISYCSSYIDLGININDNLYFKKHIGLCCTRGRVNVQSTQKWEVNNLFVQSIFQFCAVNFSILNKNICIILINLWRHYVIQCEEFTDIVTLLSTTRSPITTDCGVIYRKEAIMKQLSSEIS